LYSTKNNLKMKSLLFSLLAILTFNVNINAQNQWLPVTPGANAAIRDLAKDNFGNLYACGNFSNIGGINAGNIAKFDGQTWSSINSELGFTGQYIYRVEVIDGILYAMGQFSSIAGINASCIAKWDGQSWQPMGSGFNGSTSGFQTNDPIVTSIVKYNNELYIGGDFLYSNGQLVNSLAKWNGIEWVPVGTGIGGMYPGGALVLEHLLVNNNELYACGEFQNINGINAKAIAKFNGTNWSNLGAGSNLGWLFEMTFLNNELYVVGSFNNIDGINVTHIAKWNGTNWSGLSNSFFDNSIGGIGIYNNELIVCGSFTNISGNICNRIAKFNGQNWQPFGVGFNASASDIESVNNVLYCSGSFTQSGNETIERLGFWNGCNNSSVTPQLNALQIGNTATFTASTSNPNPNFVWQSDFGQGFQTLNNFGNYSGVNTNSLSIANVQLSEHNQPIRVITTSGNCIDTSNVAVINLIDTCIAIFTINDTITTQVFDTTYVSQTIYDTLQVTIYDTLLTAVTDTLIINSLISGLNPPNNLNTMKLFPNPASTHITIDYGNFNAMSGYTLTIVNSIGQTVFTTPINQQTSFVDLSTWTGNGIYFVKLIDPQNNIIENRKIVIQ
jgi:hypothetical protein